MFQTADLVCLHSASCWRVRVRLLHYRSSCGLTVEARDHICCTRHGRAGKRDCSSSGEGKVYCCWMNKGNFRGPPPPPSLHRFWDTVTRWQKAHQKNNKLNKSPAVAFKEQRGSTAAGTLRRATQKAFVVWGNKHLQIRHKEK